MIKALQLIAILLTAVSMAGGWAHLLEIPNKMNLSREDYLIVQQIYRGWALLGIAIGADPTPLGILSRHRCDPVLCRSGVARPLRHYA